MNLPSEYLQIAKSGSVVDWNAYRDMVNEQRKYQGDFSERNNLDGLDRCDDKDYFQDIQEFNFQCNAVYFGWRDGKYCIAMLGKGLCAFQYKCDLITADTKDDADRLMLIECKRQREDFDTWRESLK